MKILVTNDDGFQSPYLEILCETLSQKHSIYLVCPGFEQSGIGQAISIYKSLSYSSLEGKNYPAFKVDGTPSDCVKLAVCHLLKDVSFDLVVSGINPGENAGLSTLYSGTVAGAREGATWSIPSIALSVWNSELFRSQHAAQWLLDLLENKDYHIKEPGVFWNVNFPSCPPSEISGTKICTMSRAEFKDKYIEYHTPRGTSEFWLDGYKHPEHFLEGTDDSALKENNIAITPLSIDQTSRDEHTRLTQINSPLIIN